MYKFVCEPEALFAMAGPFGPERFLHHSSYSLGPHGFSCHPYMHPTPFQLDPRFNASHYPPMYFEGQGDIRRGTTESHSRLQMSFAPNTGHPRLKRSRTLPQDAMFKHQYSEEKHLFRQQSYNVTPTHQDAGTSKHCRP